MDKCVLNKSLERLRKLPLNVLIKEPLNEKLLSEYEVKFNRTIMKVLNEIQGQCNAFCEREDCLEHEYVPFVVGKSGRDRLSVILYGSNAPTIDTISMPLLTIVDFLVYIVSSISFWLGASPLGLLSYIKTRNEPNLMIASKRQLPRNNFL